MRKPGQPALQPGPMSNVHPSQVQHPHSVFSTLQLGLSFWGVHSSAACSAAGEPGRGRAWGQGRQRSNDLQEGCTMVIWSWAAGADSDVHSGPSWSGKLAFPRAMTRGVGCRLVLEEAREAPPSQEHLRCLKGLKASWALQEPILRGRGNSKCCKAA